MAVSQSGLPATEGGDPPLVLSRSSLVSPHIPARLYLHSGSNPHVPLPIHPHMSS